MVFATLKIFFSAGLIAFSSWLSGKKPELAGFIIALPLASLLALAFSYAEYHDAANSVRFARSILVALPLTLVFFVPFLLAEKLPLGFWGLYGTGLALLVAAWFAHKWILSLF